jgi:hypothetical protein
VCVIARVLEEHGLATTAIALVREHAERVKPPRALFVPFPFGHPLGKPHDAEGQRRVLRAALALFDAERGPVLADYPDDPFAGEDINLPQAAGVPSVATATDVAAEAVALRPAYERWLAANDGRTGVGLTGITPERVPALVELLVAYAAGQDADLPERQADVWLPQYVRWAADDLKAYYFEARMAERPDEPFQARHRWFWGETAAANLCRAIRDRMKAAGDPKLDGVAFGIAR